MAQEREHFLCITPGEADQRLALHNSLGFPEGGLDKRWSRVRRSASLERLDRNSPQPESRWDTDALLDRHNVRLAYTRRILEGDRRNRAKVFSSKRAPSSPTVPRFTIDSPSQGPHDVMLTIV